MNAYDRLLRLGENAARLTQALFSLPLPETTAGIEVDDPILRLSALLESVGSTEHEANDAPATDDNALYPSVSPNDRIPSPARRRTGSAARPTAARRIDFVDSPPVVIPESPTAPNGHFLNTLRVLNLDTPDVLSGEVVGTQPAPSLSAAPDSLDRQSDSAGSRHATPDRMAVPELAQPNRNTGQFLNRPDANGGGERPVTDPDPKFDTVRPPNQTPPQGMRLTRGVSRLESLLRANLADSVSDSVTAPQPGFEEAAKRAAPLQKLPATEDHHVPAVPEATALKDPAPFHAPDNGFVGENALPARAQAEDESDIDIQRLLDQIADQLEFDLIRTYGTSRKL